MDEPQKDESTEFKYSPDDNLKSQGTQMVPSDLPSFLSDKVEKPLFKWTSPDSFSASKSAVWYLVLLGITLGVTAGIYFLTKDKITTAVILVSGLLMGIYGSRKPHMISYEIDQSGFSINGHYHQYGDYRSFAIIHHGDGRSIILTPLKRFMPYTYIYCKQDVESRISSLLSSILPSETSQGDAIDRFLRKVGF